MHIQEAERTLGSGIPWICDGMENHLKHALGNAPNSEFIIDPNGVVLRRRAWSRPAALRADLEQIIGPVASPTRAEDLKLETQPPPRAIATGVVERVKMPGRMQPLKIKPVFESVPFYAKLRAEITEGFFRERAGTLYLGFHLDPLYHVHWNNLTGPLEFEIAPAATAVISPNNGHGPKVEQPADNDPREFLVDIKAKKPLAGPLELTVRYFACDDANTFCVPVTQHYQIYLERDPDGGRARRGNGGFGRGGAAWRARLLRRDASGDGRLSRDELPPFLRDRFASADLNDDGFLETSEFEELRPRFRAGAFASRSALWNALDIDRDGNISAPEIDRAAGSLRSLDDNGDGSLQPREYSGPPR